MVAAGGHFQRFCEFIAEILHASKTVKLAHGHLHVVFTGPRRKHSVTGAGQLLVVRDTPIRGCQSRSDFRVRSDHYKIEHISGTTGSIADPSGQAVEMRCKYSVVIVHVRGSLGYFRADADLHLILSGTCSFSVGVCAEKEGRGALYPGEEMFSDQKRVIVPEPANQCPKVSSRHGKILSQLLMPLESRRGTDPLGRRYFHGIFCTKRDSCIP